MADQSRSIHVYAHWAGLAAPVCIGVLTASRVRGKEIFAFEYDSSWLGSGWSMQLDPELLNFTGYQYPSGIKQNFGAFTDSSPDRWGRTLIKRREAYRARNEKRKVRTLCESDYLLGVFDENRMGGLRFKLDKSGAFLDDNESMAAPPWTSLGELGRICLNLERDNAEDDPDFGRWIERLIAPGSSLGGARPKAGVVDEEGRLWIAKFPSAKDEWDVGAWEMVAHELARMAGLTLPVCMTGRFLSNHHTFLTRRFDRTPKGERVHFASAMTMLGYTDGADAYGGVSYLELSEFLLKYGADPISDLEELWKRIVLYITISNTDDHLRNHGFLLTYEGWRLAPAYDINPNPHGYGLSLNITDDDNRLDLELAREAAPYFRIDALRSKEIIEGTKNAVSHWSAVADKYGIPRREKDLMASAFLDANTH